MKGIFDAYVLRPLDKKKFELVMSVTPCDFTVMHKMEPIVLDQHIQTICIALKE